MLGKWVIMGLIGFCVGIIGFLLHNLIEEIAKLKWIMVEKYIKVSIVYSSTVLSTLYK
jgi:chloride channel 7